MNETFSGFANIDLLSVGIAVAANLILGYIVLIRQPRSATAVLFALQTLVLSVWSVVNYLSYQITEPTASLLLVRLVMFFAVPNSLIFLLLMNTFPDTTLRMSKRGLWTVVTAGAVTMVVALSPLLFSGVRQVEGGAPEPIVGPGILLFMLTAVLSVPVGLWFLLRRQARAVGEEKLQLRYLLLGVSLMFTFILLLNFVLPAFYQNSRFIPLSAVFTLPFVLFTAYAIFKHHLLNIKIITTEIAAFLLSVASLVEVVLSQDIGAVVFRSGIFVLVLSFSILLIKSVRKEVEQREELEKLTKELGAANAKLEELSRFKTQLLSIASHQIRSPLAAIKGFAQLVIDGSYGTMDDRVKETVKKMMQSANGLIDLINTLLDLRKVEEGRMEYQFTKTDLVKLVSETFEGLRSLAEAKKLEFTLKAPKGELWVNADGQKLKQVFQNIIDNSIKYTPMGYVHVELYEASPPTGGGAVMFSVSDSGLGFAPEMASHLFEEFVRDERVKKQILGTGLGLFIARKIIEAHGGKVWAESKGLQKGATFFVTLKKI